MAALNEVTHEVTHEVTNEVTIKILKGKFTSDDVKFTKGVGYTLEELYDVFIPTADFDTDYKYLILYQSGTKTNIGHFTTFPGGKSPVMFERSNGFFKLSNRLPNHNKIWVTKLSNEEYKSLTSDYRAIEKPIDILKYTPYDLSDFMELIHFKSYLFKFSDGDIITLIIDEKEYQLRVNMSHSGRRLINMNDEIIKSITIIPMMIDEKYDKTKISEWIKNYTKVLYRMLDNIYIMLLDPDTMYFLQIHKGRIKRTSDPTKEGAEIEWWIPAPVDVYEQFDLDSDSRMYGRAPIDKLFDLLQLDDEILIKIEDQIRLYREPLEFNKIPESIKLQVVE